MLGSNDEDEATNLKTTTVKSGSTSKSSNDRGKL